MRKYIIPPVVAVIGGVVGCALRAWGLKTAFEPETGLPISGAPATWVLILLSAAMVVALAALLRRNRGNGVPGGYDRAFAVKNNTAYMTCMVLSGFAMIGAALLMFLAFAQRENTSIIRLILAVMCLASGVCVLYTGKNNYRGEGKGKYSFHLLMPAYTCCVWLIAAYQVRAGDPVQLDYIYELFAIIAALLGLYFTAGFSFAKPRLIPCALFSLLGVYFSIVTLADGHDLASTLLYGAVILMPLVSTVVLLRNASMPEGAVEADPQADDTEEINEEGPSDES